jgi:hypothetical protein
VKGATGDVRETTASGNDEADAEPAISATKRKREVANLRIERRPFVRGRAI